MQGNKGLIIGLVTGIAVLLVVAAVLTVLLVRRGGLSVGGGVSGKGGTDAPVQAEVLFVVGEDIALSDVTGFEYLFSSSGGMADYHGEAWSFRVEDGTAVFRYREGNGPEVDREIETGAERTLTEEEWEAFLSCVDGGRILDQDAAYSHTESVPPGVMDGGGGHRSICSLTWEGQRKRTRDKRFEYASDGQAEKLRQLVSELQEKTEDETGSDIPVTVMYAEEFVNADGREIKEWTIDGDNRYGAKVVFFTNERLQDFSVRKLEYAKYEDDGSVSFEIGGGTGTDLLDETKAVQAEVVFAGDTPNYGVLYTDTTGTRHYYAIRQSGRDGSLFLEEFEPRESKRIAVGDYFEYSVRLPEQWEDRILWETEPAYDDGGKTLETMLTLYLKSERELENNAGGMLCRLVIRLDPTELPTRCEIAGTLLMDGYSVYHLTAEFPGDVQFSTPETVAEAGRFYDDIEELYDSVRFAPAIWHYIPAETGHRQEALYWHTRYGYLWANDCRADETELAERGLSTCYQDAGYPDDEGRMRYALHDLNDDGTNEFLVMLDDAVRAIHTIDEDGTVVMTYSCPAGSEMTVMSDGTILVTSPPDGNSRTYRMTSYAYGLVDAGKPQTDEPLILQSGPMSPHAVDAGDHEAGGTQDEEDIAEQNFRYSHGGYSKEEFIAYVYGTMWAKNGDENSAIVDLKEDGTFIAMEGMGGVVEATGTYEFRADQYGPHRPFLFTMYREDGSVFTEFELVYSPNLKGEIVLFFGSVIYRRIY